MIFGLLALATQQHTDDFSKTWDEIARSIQTRYYARRTRKSEMDALLTRYAPQAKAVTSRIQFEHVVNAMIRDFHDSHFGYFTESDQEFYLMENLVKSDKSREMPEFGAWFANGSSSDGYTVSMVLDGSEAAKAGLRKDDVITQVDGQPFTPIDSIKPLVGSKVTLTVRRADVTLTPQVTISSERALSMFLDASRDSSRIIDDNGKKIGYFHLWTQASNDFRTALELAVYSKLRETDAFILDLRDGFGGRPEGYGDPFFRPNVWLDWGGVGGSSGYRQLFGYGRPLIVLINGGSRSAKEVLSYIFKKSKRAVLVGQTTAGNVLGTFPQAVNDWGYLEIPISDLLVDGIRLEGKGVDPNVRVPQEFGPDGKDLDLQTALDRLAK